MGILKDVEVFVKVNGDKLEEHIDHDDAGESTDCMVRYVEAQDGAEFEIGFVSLVPFDITYHGSHSYQGLCFALSVDGQKVRSTVVHGTRLSGTARGVELRENRGWILKPFKFAQIVTSETENLSDEASRSTDTAVTSGGALQFTNTSPQGHSRKFGEDRGRGVQGQQSHRHSL